MFLILAHGLTTRANGCPKRLCYAASSMAATSTQKLAVWLAFLAAALSFAAVAVTAARSGRIDATPLFGGLFMLALGIAGVVRLRQLPPG